MGVELMERGFFIFYLPCYIAFDTLIVRSSVHSLHSVQFTIQR